jgi:hypothetical protein
VTIGLDHPVFVEETRTINTHRYEVRERETSKMTSEVKVVKVNYS